jgi:hypothetical protein
LLSGQQLMARLALVIPWPKAPPVSYRGVFASHSQLRELVLPASQPRPASISLRPPVSMQSRRR